MRVRSILAALLLSAAAIVPAAAMPPWMRGALPVSTIVQYVFTRSTSSTGTSSSLSLPFQKAPLPSNAVLVLLSGSAYNGANTAVTAPSTCTSIFYVNGSTASSAVNSNQEDRAWICRPAQQITLSGITDSVVVGAYEIANSHSVVISSNSLSGTSNNAPSKSAFATIGHTPGLRVGVIEYDSGTPTLSFAPQYATVTGVPTTGSYHNGTFFSCLSTFTGNLTVSFSSGVNDPTELQADIH